MKLPNSYGSVYKLSGRRRRPWAVRKTASWEMVDGEKARRKYTYIGYYETKAKALQALAEYNAAPFGATSHITFAEVYDRWSDRKFKDISSSNINGYRAAYALCEDIYHTRFAELKLGHLQAIVDNANKNYPTLKKLRVLFNQLFDYAVMHEIIGKDRHIVEYVDIGKSVKSDKHYRFTDAEIQRLWAWSENNDYVQVILMLIYSAVRPGEMFSLLSRHVNTEDRYIYVERGKNDNAARRVPIHDRVLPFYQNWLAKETEYLITQLNGSRILFASNHGQYTETYWKPILLDIGILSYTNDAGDVREHSPDDTRHTFTTMWKEKKLDEAMRRKIQGHSGKGIGEIVYTHFEFKTLLDELNRL